MAGREGYPHLLPPMPPPALPPPQFPIRRNAGGELLEGELLQMYYAMVSSGMGTQPAPMLPQTPAWPIATAQDWNGHTSQDAYAYQFKDTETPWHWQQQTQKLPDSQANLAPEIAPAEDTAQGDPEAPVAPEYAAMNQQYSSAVADFLAGGDAFESDAEDEEMDVPSGHGGTREAETNHTSQATPEHSQPQEPVTASVRVESSEPQHFEQQFARVSTSEELQAFLTDLRRRPLSPELNEDKVKGFNTKISSAILSLYRDRIKPTLSNVQRRLVERQCSEALIQVFVTLCAREPGQYNIVLPKEGEQLQILLAKEAKWFEGWVDFDNPDGDYSKDVWEALSSFLEDENVILPGQPYLAALDLRKKGVLENLCLGELEHVVRISLGKRQLLAPEGNCLRPAHVFADSTTVDNAADAKQETSSVAQRASNSEQEMKLPEEPKARTTVRRTEDLTVVMLHLMRAYRNGIPLINLKSALQAKYSCAMDLEALCPMVLGRATLLEVFKVQPLSDVFPLKALDSAKKNMLVLPPRHDKIPQAIWYQFYYGSSPKSWEPDPLHTNKAEENSNPPTSVPAVSSQSGATPISIANSMPAPNATSDSTPVLSQLLQPRTNPGGTQVAEAFIRPQPPAPNYTALPVGYIQNQGIHSQPALGHAGSIGRQQHPLSQAVLNFLLIEGLSNASSMSQHWQHYNEI